MNQENNAERAKALDKIRKLLAMAYDGRGNEHEAANAARQAEALMRKYQVDNADLVTNDLKDDGSFVRTVVQSYFGPIDKRYKPKEVTTWVGYIAVGIGRAFTCKVDVVHKSAAGEYIGAHIRFSGYEMDVEIAVWTYKFLCDTVQRLSTQYAKGQGATTAKMFRLGAGGMLAKRLKEMADEREREQRGASNSTALVLYDQKALRVKEMFGETRTSASKQNIRNKEAYFSGQQAGKNIAINRPLTGSGTKTSQRVSNTLRIGSK